MSAATVERVKCDTPLMCGMERCHGDCENDALVPLRETAADRRVRRQALLRGAKAWRSVAPFAAGDYLVMLSGESQRAWNRIPSRVYEAMRDRMEGFLGVPTFREARLSYFEQCLAALFMALECEDEARALAPTKPAKKSRQRRAALRGRDKR